jgi:hypothetical protein
MVGFGVLILWLNKVVAYTNAGRWEVEHVNYSVMDSMVGHSRFWDVLLAMGAVWTG